MTATPLYVAAAHVCISGTDQCRDVSASAKVSVMATMQLGERIRALVKRTSYDDLTRARSLV